MPRGGKRPGAGRPVGSTRPKVVLACADPESLLRAIVQNDWCTPELRARVAMALLKHELTIERFKAQLFVDDEQI